MLVAGLALGGLAVAATPAAPADTFGYLLSVATGPGYHFANSDEALAYGHGICDKIAHGERYAAIVGDIKTDLSAPDDYQSSYLISQAAEELCPNLIWQLKNSAADYRPTA